MKGWWLSAAGTVVVAREYLQQYHPERLTAIDRQYADTLEVLREKRWADVDESELQDLLDALEAAVTREEKK